MNKKCEIEATVRIAIGIDLRPCVQQESGEVRVQWLKLAGGWGATRKDGTSLEWNFPQRNYFL